MQHGDHPAVIKRLKRANGHLQKIIEMLEQGRPCPQIAQQLQAVEGAVQNAKKALIHDHISHCVNRSLKAADRRPQRDARVQAGRAVPVTSSPAASRTSRELALGHSRRRHALGSPRLWRGRSLSCGPSDPRPSPQPAHSDHDRTAENVGG